MVLVATLKAPRRSTAWQTSGIFADARTYLRGIKKSSALPSEDTLRGAFPDRPWSCLKLNGSLMESDNDWVREGLPDGRRTLLVDILKQWKGGARKLFIKGFISVLLSDIRDNYKFGKKVDINIIKKRMLKNLIKLW